MKKVIERIRTAAALAVLIALAAGGAGAATVTTVGGVGDDVTVQNVTGNAGGYVWNTTTMTLTLPAKENLPRGSAVEIVSVEMVEVGTSTQNSIQYGIPATLTIGSATATLDNSEAYDGTLFGAVNNAKLAKYEFAEGNRPVFMVGLPSAVSMTFSGNSTRLRALPTNSNGDSTDLVVGVGNTQYQPCIRITGKIVSTSVYTATTEATSANFSELTWSPSISGVNTSSASLVINAPNLATLTIDETRTAGSLFVDSAASTLTVNQSGENILTAKGLGVASSILFKIAGTAPLTITDGGIKGASEIYVTAGTTLNLSNVASPAKINAYGTVKTAGTDVTLLSNSDNRFQNTSHLNVTAGNTFVSSPSGSSGANNGISKQITIASGAKLSAVSSDGLAYNRSVVIDVYGTLEFYNGCYWSTGNNTINLYEGAVVSGSQTGSRGTLDFNNTSSAKINAYGDAEITAAVRPNYSSVGVYVAEGKTLSISVAPIIASGGSFAKTGAGTLQFKNIAAIPVTGSEGCVELLNNSSSAIKYTTTLGFSGILKTTRNGSGHIAIGSDSEDTTQGNILLTGSPTLEIGGTNPYLCLNKQVAGNWLAIKNLTASSSSTVIDPVYGGADTDTYIVKTLKNLQTENTTFAGTFNGSSASGRRVDLEVYGQNETVRSLTLSGNNTNSYGTLTIRDYAKVIFEGSGNWAQGSVVVNEHGYIESKNSNAVASTLTLGNGATIVASSVNDAAVALCGTTVTLPDGGTVYVDLSGVVADPGDVVTILSATTLNNGDTATFEATSGSWRFATSGTTVTATKLGTLTWDGTNWSDSNFTGYTAATIAVSGSQTVTLPDSCSLDTLTLSGSGVVAFAPTTAETLSATTIMIGNGVTLDASDALALTGVTINNEGASGTGSFKIPEGVTCTMEGVTCTARIYCYGNLITRGDTDLSCASTGAGSWSYFYSGSKLTVATGETKIRSESQGLKGNIEIASGATLTENRGYDDGLDFNSTLTIDVRGTLAMGSVRWTVGANNTINIYEGAMVTGSVAGNGNLDWKDTGSVVNVNGDADVDANLRFRNGCDVAVNVAEGKTLTIKKPFATSTASGTLTKSGDGTLRLEDVMCTSAGQTTEPTIAGSEGTVEFFSKTNHRYMNKPVTFSGKVKFTQDSTNSKELIVNSTTLFANRPSLEVSGGFTMHSNLAADNVALEVSNLSGSGTISPKFGEQATARIVDTKQTTETVFRGVFSHHQSQGDRKTGLVVRGDGTTTVHSLTLTAENGTTGPLTVLNYGKVIFGENASWGNGTVTVGANGYLESVNAAAVAKLTLQDGAHIVFPAATSSLGGISELAFATGTTYISFPDGVTPTDGATLIDWSAASLEAAPAGEFKLEGTAAESYVLTKSATGLVISKSTAFASITDNGNTTFCQNAIELAQAVSNAADTYDFVTILGNGEVSLYWLDGLKIKNPNNAAISFIGLGSDCSLSTAMEGGVTTYTKSPVPTAYTWTGQAKQTDPENLAATIPDPAWTKARNWQYTPEGDATTTATRYPQAGDTVIFGDGATVTLDADATVAGMVVNGAVSISASQKSLNLTGNVTGDGTLTLSDVCMANANGGGITVVPAVHFTNDSELAGDNALTLNGDVAISDTFKVWDSNHAINGNVTINSGVTFKYGALLLINGAATVKGAFTRDAGSTSCIKFCGAVTIENGNVSIDGWQSGNLDDAATVVLAGSGASLTDTRGNPITDNKVSTTVADSYVKKSGNTYSVAAKRTATVSVGTNASLSINGNAVADGDAVKFVPGDVLTITASADTYYTPALTVNSVAQTSPYELTTTDADVTVSATATRDTVAITIPSVANTTVSVDYVKDGAAANATTAGNITVDAGTSLTATWTAASGYRITAGASQTINSVAAAQTLAEPTVVANAVTFTGYTVEYTADYSKAATITATVSGEGAEGATYTLTAGGNNYNGTYNAGTVTFSNITAPSLGSELSYTISASGAASGTSGAQTETVGNVTSGWVQEDATHNESTGTWETDIAYSDGVAAITDNTYTPNKPGNGIMTLETVVKFGNEADPEVAVGDGVQAAVKIANGQFAVYGKATSDGTASWQSTEVAADVDATYTVKLIINYNTGTFTISVKKNGAETATPLGSAWHLATAAATKVSSIAYKGTGAFTSLNGSFISGDVDVTVETTDDVAVSSDFISKYLKDKTVAEAAAALNPNATDAASNPEAFAADGNGINYFKCYALGLDPTKADDKPIVDVTTDAEGKFVFTVKHPVYNEQGEIIGYEKINAADNVSTTVTLKYGTDASSITTVEKGAASGISPADMFEHAGAGNVIYYKAEVTIGAK